MQKLKVVKRTKSKNSWTNILTLVQLNKSLNFNKESSNTLKFGEAEILLK